MNESQLKPSCPKGLYKTFIVASAHSPAVETDDLHFLRLAFDVYAIGPSRSRWATPPSDGGPAAIHN